MKIIVTGGFGFLGRKLVPKLLQDGHKLLLVSRTLRSIPNFDRFPNKPLICGENELAQALNQFGQVDAILHAATDYGRDPADIHTIFNSNEVFPMMLMEIALKRAIKTFINIDTFFNQKNTTYSYLEGYTISKRHFMEWGQYCAKNKFINFVNLKLFHIYGEGDKFSKFVNMIVDKCLNAEPIGLASGLNKRDFIYIDDVVSAISLILTKSDLNGFNEYEVGTGELVSIKDFVELALHLTDGKSKVTFGELLDRDGEFSGIAANNNSLRTIGWHPKINLNNGIKLIIQDLKMAKKNEVKQ